MSENSEKEVKRTRRRFLKSATKLAVYTPPAMIAVSTPNFAAFANSTGGEVFDSGAYPSRKKRTSKKKTGKKKTTKKKTTKKKTTKKKTRR
jgi:hypothetical protein